MNWNNVSRKVGTHVRLVSEGDQVQSITEHVVTFYLSGQERPDERKHPFFTGVGATRAAAEEAAYLVYLKAQACTHTFERQDAAGLVCSGCGVLLRPQAAAVEGRSQQPWWRRWFGREQHRVENGPVLLPRPYGRS